MDIRPLPQSNMGEQPQMPLSSIIHSLQLEDSCPSEVLARLKEYEGRTDSMEDLPADLRWIVSIVMDRDDALIQINKHLESEQELCDQLMTVRQEKELAEALAHRSLEAGLRLSEICDRYYEDYHSLTGIHFTSGSEKASNIQEPDDEIVTSDDNPQNPQTQNEARERLGEYFRLNYNKIADGAASAPGGKSSRKTTKPKESAGESTGKDILEHFGEDDIWEPTNDGYDELKKYIDVAQAKTPKASDGVNVPWIRCRPGHMGTVVANVEDREVFYGINGNRLPSGEHPPKDLELYGLSLRLMGYEVHPEIEMVPANAVVVKHMYPKYKVSLENLDTPDRASALVKLQELLGPAICVDGAKTAAGLISTQMMGSPSIEQKESPDDIVEMPAAPSEADADSEPAEDKEDVIPSASSLEELDNNAARAQQRGPLKISRRQQNKERCDCKQQQPVSGKDEEEEARKKEEQAQRKRERERQRREQKKQEKMERKKAEDPGYMPSPKRSRQRMETFVHTANNKKRRPFISGKSYWSPSLVAYILFLSLSMMLPIYRIECASAALLGGLNIPLSTLEALSVLVFSRKLKHLLPYFSEVLNGQHYVHADETVIEVFREKAREDTTKSYIWIYSTIASCPTQVRIYDYKPGRNGKESSVRLHWHLLLACSSRMPIKVIIW